MNADPLTFPCQQAYRTGDGRLWWDMNFLFLALFAVGERREKRDWIKWCHSMLVGLGLAGEVHISHQAVPDWFVSNIFTSFAALSFYAGTVDKCTKAPVVTVCAAYLKKSLRRAIEAHERLFRHVIFAQGGVAMRLAHHERISGWQDILQTMSVAMKKVVTSSWQAMVENGCLHEPLDQGTHASVDVLHFLLFFIRDRKSRNRHRLSSANLEHLIAIRNALLQWIAVGVDQYIAHEYCSAHDVDAPAPALRQHDANKRAYARVHAETIWSMFEEARATGTSVEQVIQVRHHDQHLGGCSRSLGYTWLRKSLYLYQDSSCYGQLTGASA